MKNTNGHDKIAYLHSAGRRPIAREVGSDEPGQDHEANDLRSTNISPADRAELPTAANRPRQHRQRQATAVGNSVAPETLVPRSGTGRLLGALGLAAFTAIAVLVIYQIVT